MNDPSDPCISSPVVCSNMLTSSTYLFFRECAIKFNDYFEFPREFDMEPYTVNGLAKIEGKDKA